MITVLDPKRSNAINIGLTTLPPVHVIKAALLNFDEFAVSKDGIEVGIPAKGWAGSLPLDRGLLCCFYQTCLQSWGSPGKKLIIMPDRCPDQH